MNSVRLSEVIAPAFYPVHRDVVRYGHAEYWLAGGRGSGKSSYVSIEIVCGLLRDPACGAVVFRKVGNTLRDSVYPQVCWAVEKLGLLPYFRRSLSPLSLTYLPTGQQILFRGADDPAKTKSLKPTQGYFGMLWLEELTEYGGVDDLRQIRASVLRGGERAMTFMTYNPPVSARNWVNEEALVQTERRLTHASDYRGMPPGWLGEAFIAEAEALRMQNERAWRHVYLGEVTGTGGQVFDNVTVRRISDAELAAQDKRYAGLDFGFAVDPDALVLLAYDRRARRLWFVDEYVGVRTPIARLAEEARGRAGRMVVVCDSADPRMIAELSRHGVNATAAKKGPDSVPHGVRWLQELSEIVIDPARTPNAAREFTAYEYRLDSRGSFLADVPDADNHTIDAARYAMECVSTARVARTIGGLRL